MRKFIPILCSLALCPALLFAQEQDPHFQVPRIAAIVQHSAFLHGYLHGYEEGFHEGDIDLQMARLDRDTNSHNSSPKGYQKNFGSKSMYKNGFREGFAVGYTDAVAGRRFRAVQNMIAATSAAPPTGGKLDTAAFESGVHLGYMAGRHQGLADGRRAVQAQPSPACPDRTGEAQKEFCAAYTDGFQLGYSDGFTNQARTTLAEK